MRFVVDDQLPVSLARYFSSLGHVAEHVSDIGLTGAPDTLIWKYASEIGAVIVSKDDDFVGIRARHPDGPAVVWLRVGNTRTKPLLDRMATLFPVIVEALSEGQKLIEIR
jgi:predicted nuclease of predicted toxin-antitoxin system